jgi:hypothetical protein
VLSVVNLYVESCEGQLVKVVPVKRQPRTQAKDEAEPTQEKVDGDPEDTEFNPQEKVDEEEDPEDTEFNPSSEGEDDEIESDEEDLEENEVEADTQ